MYFDDLDFTYYKGNLLEEDHYYPYGLQIQTLHVNSLPNDNPVKYGFNGQEKEDEIAGRSNITSAQFWQYDATLGRRWNLDPVDQVRISNYVAFGNNPIAIIDPLGDKIKNAVRGRANKQRDVVDQAQRSRDKLGKRATKRQIKMADKTLRKATNKLVYLQRVADGIDKMLEDYKTVDPMEYERLDNLTDAEGNVVDISIDLLNRYGGDNGKDPNNYMETDLNAADIGAEFQSGSNKYSDYWTGTFSGDIKINIFKNGLSNKYLANEFGDIDYFFKHVKVNDIKSFDKWLKTGNNRYGRYDEKGGAGYESFQYQYRFEGKFRKYVKDRPKLEVDWSSFTFKKR